MKKSNPKSSIYSTPSIFKQIFLIERLKAFLTDIFMVYMPVLYITTYVVLGSKEALWQNQIAILVCFLLYAIITSLFFACKSQSLGYMYAEIILLRDNGAKITFILAFVRFVIFCVSMSLVFGIFVPFLRKDRKTFHDVVCKTHIQKHKRNVNN